ncbi:MAG: hydrolase [Planctomycetia bacterium]|nr:hydrolase [Planctomycetia bacterium]
MSTSLPRSPEMMSAGDTALVIVDMQVKLMPLIPGQRRIIFNARRLIDGAKILGVPVAGTEQYPQGLGKTTPELASLLGELPSKVAFSCGACGEIFERFSSQGIHRVLLAGIETHVCVQQTALDLLASGFRVYLAVDALGARYAVDHETALKRMESSGATLTTTESALFEWCQQAGTPQFRQISQLVREAAPEG